MIDQPTPSHEERGQAPSRRSHLRRAFDQLRIKITLPYAILALLVTLSAAFLLTRLLVGLLENRFETALIDAGHKATDTVVWIEREQLTTWRAIAYTEGLAEAVAEEDGDAAVPLASPHLLNDGLDCLELLDGTGDPILAMHHRPGGSVSDYDLEPGSSYAEWEVVQRVLDGETDEIGDKYAGLVETDWGWVFYTVGPIRYEDRTVGVLMVGTYLDRVVERLNSVTLADVSVYVEDGPPLVTSLTPYDTDALALDGETYHTVLERQAQEVLRRDVQVAERGYAEVFGPFEARHGEDLGVLSVALPLSFVTEAQHPTRQTMLSLFGAVTVLIFVTGALVANAVVRRIRSLADATRQVAGGNLATQVEIKGYDEVASLAQDFNHMVLELREGRLYRDLLGLTASPEVAERLRQGVQKGRLHLQAQSVIATVLFADIRGFTRLSEDRNPTYVIDFLNEYLQSLIKPIRAHDGVINKFAGDAALAFFGVLPEALPAEESARQALDAALEILDSLKAWNREREERGEHPVQIGIGLHTGLVVVGTLGSEERFEYTIIGDTVNVTQRLSDLNKEYPEYDLFIGADAYRLLQEEGVSAVHLGEVRVKGRARPVDVYALGGEGE